MATKKKTSRSSRARSSVGSDVSTHDFEEESAPLLGDDLEPHHRVRRRATKSTAANQDTPRPSILWHGLKRLANNHPLLTLVGFASLVITLAWTARD